MHSSQSQKLLDILTRDFLKAIPRLADSRLIVATADHPKCVKDPKLNPWALEKNILPELGYLVKGSRIIFRAGDLCYTLSQGDAFMVPRMIRHAESPAAPYEVLWIGFAQVRRLWALHCHCDGNGKKLKQLAAMHITVPPALVQQLDKIDPTDPAATTVCRSALAALGKLMANKIANKEVFFPTSSQEKRPWKQQALTKVEHYLAEHSTEKLTLSGLAQQMSLSPGHLAALFKLEYGDTVFAYLVQKRLGRAMELLQDISLNISEIADMLHYKDIYFFSKQFKKYFGISPSEFRSMSLRAL